MKYHVYKYCDKSLSNGKNKLLILHQSMSVISIFDEQLDEIQRCICNEVQLFLNDGNKYVKNRLLDIFFLFAQSQKFGG